MLKEKMVVRKNGCFREIFANEDIKKFRTIFTEKVKFLYFL